MKYWKQKLLLRTGAPTKPATPKCSHKKKIWHWTHPPTHPLLSAPWTHQQKPTYLRASSGVGAHQHNNPHTLCCQQTSPELEMSQSREGYNTPFCTTLRLYVILSLLMLRCPIWHLILQGTRIRTSPHVQAPTETLENRVKWGAITQNGVKCRDMRNTGGNEGKWEKAGEWGERLEAIAPCNLPSPIYCPSPKSKSKAVSHHINAN